MFAYGLKNSIRNPIAIFHDAVMAFLSFIISVYILVDESLIKTEISHIWYMAAIYTLICVAVFSYMRLYRGSWRYASMRDLSIIVKAVTSSIAIFALVAIYFGISDWLPRSITVVSWMTLLILLGAPRFIYRAMNENTLSLGWNFNLRVSDKIPVLLIGADDAAEQFIRSTQRNAHEPYEVAGIIDNNQSRRGRTIHRIKIYGNEDTIPKVIEKLTRNGKRPQKIIISNSNASSSDIRSLFEMADSHGISIARLPKLSEFKQGVGEKTDIIPVAVEDLLGRPQHVLDRSAMRELVEGKRVLITGAGGTIGGELTRQIASYNPKMLTVIELNEFNMYQIEKEIRNNFPDIPFNCILADVRDTIYINNIFEQCKPELVFHAAALKHVPIAEYNIEETILTNVFGSRNIAEACLKNKVSIMVMISTDKAVNPTNVMGASKRLAESFCQALGKYEKESMLLEKSTKFITVRFGNVLGSTGSVVPLFKEQLSKGGPLTVTDPEMTRYFMTVREAVELVLQASVLGNNMQDKQEYIFVLDMGQPVKILDLALQMIKLAGLKPYEDIEIKFTGLRPGEKLYEELFHDSENIVKTSHESIFLAHPRQSDLKTLRKSFSYLEEACKLRSADTALELLKQLVPEFTTTSLNNSAKNFKHNIV